MPAEWPEKALLPGYHEHAYGVLAGPARAVVRPQPLQERGHRHRQRIARHGPGSAILMLTRWPARRRRCSSPTPPRPAGCGPGPTASSPTKPPTSRSST